VKHGALMMRVVKGAPDAIAALIGATSLPDAEKLAAEGYRVLAIAAGPEQSMTLAGFIALLWMAPLPAVVVIGLLGAVISYLFAIDFLKICGSHCAWPSSTADARECPDGATCSPSL
jgi:hypothetical protein